MNEFAIEWTYDRTYAGVTAPSESALKNNVGREASKKAVSEE